MSSPDVDVDEGFFHHKSDLLSATGISCVWNQIQMLFQEGRMFVACMLAIIAFFVFAIVFWWRRRVEITESEEPISESVQDDHEKSMTIDSTSDASIHDPGRRDSSIDPKYRFRKRDKAVYTAKKLLRTVKNFGRSGSGISRRFKPNVMKFATQWLSRTKEKQALRTPRGPPSTFFEPDAGSDVSGSFPPEIFYVLKNIRVFGHFEKPCFLELCRHVTEISVPAGQYLFKPGDNDDSIYVVQKGHISVYINEHDQEYEVKKAGPGESILSLLSILDVLTGHAAPFKTVGAKANEDSTILKLSGTAFNEIFGRYPESWVRTIQIIALRLQKVTFTTLHQYLGLSMELTKPTLREPTKRTRMSSGEALRAQQLQRSNSFASRGVRHVMGENTHSEPQLSDAPSDPEHAVVTTPSTMDAQMSKSPMQASVPSTSSTMPPIGLPPKPVPVSKMHGKDVLGPTMSHPVSGRFTIGQTSHHADAEYWKKVASEQLTQVLGLTNEAALLEGRILVQTYPPGHTLTEQGSENVDLMYVLSGALELTQKSVDDGKSQIAAVVHSHELVGGLAMLTGEPSFYTIKTRLQTRVAIITKECFYQIMREKPRIVLNVAHTVVVRLSPFIRSIDFALDWEMCDAGKGLYSQGDPGDSLYVVLSGRLRSVWKKTETDKQLVGEYGRGDLVGLVEVLTSRPRATTIISVRYTELAKVPSGLLNYIKMRYPQVLTRIIHLLGHCILGQQETRFAPTSTPYTVGYGVDGGTPHVASLNTIAIVAVSEEVPLGPFAQELMYALKSIKPTRLLSRDVIERDIGATALLPVNEYRLFSWLSQQEDTYPMVLYQCDYELTAWSRRCIRQADCILIVANGDMKPTVGPLEELFDRLGVRAQKNLILLWSENTERPKNTQDWLDVCGWVSSHYHVRAPHRLYVQARRDSRKVAEFYMGKYSREKVDRSSDFARLARMLTGRSIGLVLGGGGARGAAHLGVLRALKECNIPIDFVGGTSIGSFVGGLYCSDPDVGRVTQKAREWFMDMTSYVRYIPELTYPHSAMFTGTGFNRMLQKFFDDRLIEDLWIPYFNVTTDISASQMRVHKNGSLWRYCRASMSLAGYFPPICDPLDDGHQLLDGGYVNNLPADVMRSMGVGEILAVDVGSVDETNLTNYGDSLNGWWVVWKKYCPWGQPLKVLNMAEIQTRLAYVSCVRQLELVKKAPYCCYIRPPIDKFGTLDFALFDEICNVGYQYGKTLLDNWMCSGKLDEIRQGKPADGQNVAELTVCSTYQSPQTFTDLAAFVSKIEPAHHYAFESDFTDSETDDLEAYEEEVPTRKGSDKSATPTPEDEKSKESRKQSNGKSGNGGNGNGNRKESNESMASQDGKSIADEKGNETKE